MTLYARTALGTATMLTHRADLPRRMRTLLIAIDGRTDSASFVRTLSSFGDVLSLLESLRLAGYIEERMANGLPYRTNREVSKSSPETCLPKSGTSEVSSSVGHHTQQTRSSQYLPADGAPFAASDSDRSLVAQTQLKAAVNLMSDFVTQHLTSQALEIVIELERLSSVEELMQSLSSYEQLIRFASDKSRQHMLDLRTVLASL